MLLYRFSVKGIHHRLEGCWGVSKAEEHDSGFVEASPGLEGGFMLVSLLYSDIIVPPSDVQLCIDVGSPQVANQRGNEGERVLVAHRPFIDLSIVLYWS